MSDDPDVTISADGDHTLLTRIVDLVGHASAWRADAVRIDTVAPAVGLACSPAATWSNQVVACTVSADGGPSGISSLTVSQDGGAGSAVGGGSVVEVSADGAHTVHLAAVDGAGNSASTDATVQVDRTAPGATLTCGPDSDDGYSCRAAGSDGTSGLATLSYSVSGGTWKSVPADGSFTVAKGAVRVRALDVAGNQALTTPVTLADRTTPRRSLRS